MEINQTLRVVGDECAVVIEATVQDVVVRGWERAEVGLNAPEDAVSLRQEGDTIKVRPYVVGSDDLEVYVPHACKLALNLVSGDGEVYDVEGDVRAQSMSGDVEVHNVRGTLFARSVSGDVEISASVLRTISVETVSGDAEIESPLDVEGSYSARTTSGDIVLRVPEDQRVTVEFRSLSGDVDVDLPHASKRQGWGKTETQVNGGGVAFEVVSTSGDVHVEPSKAAAQEPFEAAEQFTRQQHASRAERATASHETTPLTTEPAGEEPFGVEEEPPAAPSKAEQRMAILKAIESGELSVNEGLAKLREI